MDRSPRGAFPRSLVAALLLPAALIAAFALTAPWPVAGRDVGRLSAVLAVAAAVGALTLLPRSWRRAWAALWSREVPRLSRRRLAFAALAATAFLGRILLARFRALDLDAWDTTLFFDHPIAATLSDGLLFCRVTGAGYLGTHASYLLLGFVPFYALFASPVWLLAAEAAALAAGAAVGFATFRRILADDLSAGMLAAGFLLNAYTARTLQYGFHPEAFYPLAVFLLWLGLVGERPDRVALAAALALSIKEDSILVLVGFAASAALFHRRWRVAAGVVVAAAGAFLVSTRIVMPHFSGGGARPWYAFYWASWADTPAAAAVAMATHPGRLARALAASGLPHLLEPLLLLPLAGPEALAAALPTLVPYAAADFRQLREFALYYAMPVLPYLFLAAAYGIRRLFGELRSRRFAAVAVLCVCAFDGAGYVLRRPHPARAEIGAALNALRERPVRIQGSLYPHAGYASTRRVLDREPPAPAEAILLCPGTDPFPFTVPELAALERRLAADARYGRSMTAGGLVLFTPRE